MSFRAGTFRKPYRDAERLAFPATDDSDAESLSLLAGRGVIRGYARSEPFSFRPEGWNPTPNHEFGPFPDVDLPFRSGRIPELRRRAACGIPLFGANGGAA